MIRVDEGHLEIKGTEDILIAEYKFLTNQLKETFGEDEIREYFEVGMMPIEKIREENKKNEKEISDKLKKFFEELSELLKETDDEED